MGITEADWRGRFRRCGENVRVAPDAEIEHPEVIEVGDDVRFGRGFTWIGAARVAQIGAHVTFQPNCFIQGSPERLVVADHVDFYLGSYLSCGDGEGSFITVGHHSHFAPGCALYGHGGLSIGDYCNVAAHCVLATVEHDPALRDGPMAFTARRAPIVIEDNVWLGANVTITPGTRVARGCVVGAGAVVTRDTVPNGIYVGVPARRLRDRE
jgi:acetyltransferase-like isoleucine patch superfamily enzyme